MIFIASPGFNLSHYYKHTYFVVSPRYTLLPFLLPFVTSGTSPLYWFAAFFRVTHQWQLFFSWSSLCSVLGNSLTRFCIALA